MKTQLLCLIFTLAGTFIFSSKSHAQAYCILRDPNREIRALYPEFTGYRSIVRSIDKKVYDQMTKELPTIRLYLAELGRHTLYVPVRGKGTLGIVHPRSEPTRSGLMDIVWSLDLNLRIKDFRFQRCRSQSRASLDTESFRAQLRGKNFAELRALLNEQCNALRPNVLKIPKGAETLAVNTIRCALKTILVTRIAWADDLVELQKSTG